MSGEKVDYPATICELYGKVCAMSGCVAIHMLREQAAADGGITVPEGYRWAPDSWEAFRSNAHDVVHGPEGCAIPDRYDEVDREVTPQVLARGTTQLSN